MSDELPTGWKIAKLGSLLTEPVRNGYSPVCPDQPTGKWILSLAAAQGGRFNANAVKPAPLNDPGLERFQLRPGDFLVSRSNTSDKVGLSCLFRGEIENCFYPDLLIRFRADNTKVLDDYLEKFLASTSALAYLQGAAAGTSGSMKKITGKTVAALPVIVPPLPEQRKIAEILSCWDQGIEKVERLIEAKNGTKRAILLAAIKGSLRKADNGRPWRKASIRELFVEVDRKLNGEAVPALSITAGRGFVDQREKFSKVIAGNSLDRYVLLRKGEFAYNKGNSDLYPCGCIYRLEEVEKGAVPFVYYCFRVNDSNANPDFYRYYFESRALDRQLTRLINSGCRNDGLLNLNREAFFSVELPVPPIEYQDFFAGLLKHFDHELAYLRSLLKAYKLQKQALMQSLLTGKIRVKV